MAKKLSFDNLPAATQKILDILTSEGSEHTALPELVQHVVLLEKKIDHLQRSLSPDRPVMDMHEVCRVLKLRPKAVNELAMSGVLPCRDQGRKTVFYEDGVVKYFMTQPAWREAASSTSTPARRTRPEPTPAAATVTTAATTNERQRVNIDDASAILNRSTAAVYQLVQAKSVPFYKDGRKVYFYADELRKWAESHPPRARGPRKS